MSEPDRYDEKATMSGFAQFCPRCPCVVATYQEKCPTCGGKMWTPEEWSNALALLVVARRRLHVLRASVAFEPATTKIDREWRKAVGDELEKCHLEVHCVISAIAPAPAAAPAAETDPYQCDATMEDEGLTYRCAFTRNHPGPHNDNGMAEWGEKIPSQEVTAAWEAATDNHRTLRSMGVSLAEVIKQLREKVAALSEPAVPAPDWWTDAINKAAAINHEILARAETAEALLRECEEVLRSAKQSDNAWFGGEFYDRLDRVIRRLAARAAPTSTPSDGSAET